MPKEAWTGLYSLAIIFDFFLLLVEEWLSWFICTLIGIYAHVIQRRMSNEQKEADRMASQF